MRGIQLVSIIIPNYNYGRFIKVAVSSALAVDWPRVEVIVVDDGSLDDSLEVLREFGDRITVLSQENAGPREACNSGFARSSGDVVIFLDSDDVLEPSIAKEVQHVWRPGISKVQVQMERIDLHGQLLGTTFPNYKFTPTPAQIRHWMTTTGAYPTPPGSGNVYNREFLSKLFPVDGRCGDATDSACLAAAPYLGDVITIPKSLVKYRVHGANRSSLIADPSRFTQQIVRAHKRHEFAMEIADNGAQMGEREIVRALRRGRHLMQMRVAESRMCGGRAPIPADGRARMFRDSVANLFAPGPESAFTRIATTMWCIATLLAPMPLAKKLVVWRFR